MASAIVERIDAPKSCELLAEQLRSRIVSGDFAPGEALPPERDLVSQSGLSRGSVREALRILEAQGLIRTRAGRYGGSVVSQPSDRALGRQIESFAKVRSVSVASLIETREAVEPMLARLAALHRTDEDLARLREIQLEMEAAAVEDVPRFLACNLRWHQALAEAGHNDLLRAFIASLSGLIEEASRIEDIVPPQVRAQVLHAHRRILSAVEAGDGDGARRRMERHLAAYSEQAKTVLGGAGPALAASAARPRSRSRDDDD